MHQFNRFYLLGSVVLSILIPFLHFEWQTATTSTDSTVYKLLQIADTGITEPKVKYSPTVFLHINNVLLTLYAIISFVLFSLFVYRLVWLQKVREKGKIVHSGSIRVVYTTTKRAPFSYMNDLYWRVDMPADDDTGRKIWEHELVHIRQKHSADKLFLQFTLIFLWINPFYWLIQRECALLHEFIADNEVNNDDTEGLAKMLLQTLFTGRNSFILNPFFHSPIKRRIMMLQKNKKTKLRRLRQLMIIPVVAGSVFFFSFTIVRPTAHRAEKRIVMVLDAGHGGADKGAQGLNGLYEKDINLKIAAEITRMAEDYNIKVVLTRPADDYVTLEQRATKANEAKADLLLSIHVNDNTQDNRYQVILDDRNNPEDKSRALASAINTQMRGLGVQPEIYNKHLVVLQHANVPAVLIECGDINNKEDVARLGDKESLRQFCANILTGVVAYAAQ